MHSCKGKSLRGKHQKLFMGSLLLIAPATLALKTVDPDGKDVKAKAFRRPTLMETLVGGLALLSSPAAAKQNAKEEVSTESLSTTITTHSDVYSYDQMLKTRDSYPFMELAHIVEPMRETEFTVAFDDVDGLTINDCSYSLKSNVFKTDVETPWDSTNGVTPQSEYHEEGNLDLGQKGSADLSSTATFQATVPSPGKYVLTITCPVESESLDTTSDVSSKHVINSFYIRRELRELPKEELDRFLDAFLIMKNTATSEGQQLYGPHYKDLEFFEDIHLAQGSGRNIDHFHEGMGIATQHVAMAAAFEQALQSIHPFMALPYWDYTIEGELVRTTVSASGRELDFSDIFRGSPLFADDVFGTTDDGVHHVTKGRFAYQDVARNYSFPTRSPYGFLRAPWNINPSRYVTRFHKFCGMNLAANALDKWYKFVEGDATFAWPSCNTHYKFTNVNMDCVDSWYEWTMNVGDNPHGPVHAWMGGVGGQCADGSWDEMRDKGLISEWQLQNMKHNSFVMLKVLWRHELIETPKYCSADTPTKDCMWTCVDNFAEHEEVKRFSILQLRITPNETNFKEIVTKAYCETPFWPGDHLEAASPVEASFWPIHPTLDRLIQYKDMVAPFEDMNWASLNPVKTCDNVKITLCKGHNAYDYTYFTVTVMDSSGSSFEVKYITNEEMRNAMHPSKDFYKLPYLYAHFEWPHCEEAGVNFAHVEDIDTSEGLKYLKDDGNGDETIETAKSKGDVVKFLNEEPEENVEAPQEKVEAHVAKSELLEDGAFVDFMPRDGCGQKLDKEAILLKGEDGRTKFMTAAAMNDDFSVGRVKAWISVGSELDATDNEGNTALMLACQKDENSGEDYSMHEGKILALLKAGADVAIKNKEGFTAFDIAVKSGCSQNLINQLKN